MSLPLFFEEKRTAYNTATIVQTFFPNDKPIAKDLKQGFREADAKLQGLSRGALVTTTLLPCSKSF